jgi:cytochrome c biogenesis factor
LLALAGLIVLTTFIYLPRFDKSEVKFLDILGVIGVLTGAYMISQCVFLAKKSSLNMMMSHAAFALGIFAISTSSLLSDEVQFAMRIGDKKAFKDFEISLDDIVHNNASNYITKTALVWVTNASKNSILEPELRIFPLERQMTSKPSIMRTFMYDLHVNINSVDTDVMLFSIYYRPMMNWLWIGILSISLALVIKAIQSFLKL